MMYHSLEAQLHDLFWATDGTSANEPAELPLIKSFLTKYSGAALELGCGSGRLLLPLIEDGYLLEGLDNAPEMLSICASKATETHGFTPVLHEASLTDFKMGSLYSAIIIPTFTLQFISVEQLPEVLSNISDHLHPDGALYFTTFIPWAEITGELEPDQWYLDHEAKMERADGKKNTAQCRTKFAINRLSQQLHRQHRYKVLSPDKKIIDTSESTHNLTWYWPREITLHLRDAGFQVEQIIGDFDAENPCHDDSQIITVIATKAEEATVSIPS